MLVDIAVAPSLICAWLPMHSEAGISMRAGGAERVAVTFLGELLAHPSWSAVPPRSV